MALQSEVSPPLVGDPNKDTQNDGETKSDENDSSSTDEDVDLEEGEILDSGEEEEEKKDLKNSSLKEALNQNCLKSLEQLVSQAKADVVLPSVSNKNPSPHNSPIKIKKRSSKYLDHDQFENNSDQEDGWFSPSRKRKSSKFDSKPIDYRKELEAYRGTPPSSPDSKHREKRKKKSSKKSKKSGKKIIKRKDIKGMRVSHYKKEAMKLKICKFYKEGKCNKGADCGFSHANPQPFRRKELCKFYLNGHCNKGKDCLFMHGEFPCKFYHTGSECYAKDDCRFSHAPLTDETKRILADYLNIRSGDEDFDRKRRNSPSPEPQEPPAKRTCLLGSPPRHIREAEETKRWQEEMLLLHQQNHPGFKIHISPPRDSTPPPFPKPNFYQETLLNSPSPQKRRTNPEPPNIPVSSSFSSQQSSSGGGYPAQELFNQGSPERYMYDDDYNDMEEDIQIKEESTEFIWTNMRGRDHNMPPVKNEMEPFVDSAQPELDFTSDVKFDETTQFSEMESSIDCNFSSPNNSSSQNTACRDNEKESLNQETVKIEDKATDDSCSAQEPVVPSIVIPSHLPKKQQELLKRIVQHQKKNPVAAAVSDVSDSPKSLENSEQLPTKQEIDTNEKTEKENEPSVWYSSDDDDDDESDDSLTDVLKKLQTEPPPVKVESKPPAKLSVMEMLNKCQQNSFERKVTSDKGEFFKSLLSGAIPPTENVQVPSLSNSTSDPFRRTLLPDPLSSSQPLMKKEPIVAPKDPRLKNRDPRTLASSVNNAFNLPKMSVLEQNIISQPSSSLISREIKMTFSSNTTTSVISEPAKEDIPYKLRGIYTKPPNYSPYISASQSNPNLLKDPRLRKHMNLLGNENGDVKRETDIIKNPPKNVPPVPKLLLAYNKDSLDINIFEPTSATKPVTDEAQDIKPLKPKLIDPRMRRRDSQNSSDSNTPPPPNIIDTLTPFPPNISDTSNPPFNKSLNAPILENEAKLSEEKKWLPTISENNWMPPVLEQSWIPPVKQEIKQEEDSDEDGERLEIDESPPCSSNKGSDDDSNSTTAKQKPTPASHLPRAIADPRLAKLHSPLDRARPRVTCSENKNTLELKKINNIPSNENSVDTSKASPKDSEAVTSENGKASKNIPKKNSGKSIEKKKTVHRNRRSSMDYASPLNSCDDSNSNKSLNYNSYNKRPSRTAVTVTDSSISIKTTNSVISEMTPDFLSDNSNLECDNNDVNLKDMFKTIDPTASPFC